MNQKKENPGGGNHPGQGKKNSDSFLYTPPGENLQASAEQIAAALNGKKSGAGWMACCPAHDDRTPSLKIDQGGDKPLVHCLAGCNQEQVIDGLRSLGLWLESKPFKINHYKRGKPDQVWPYHDEAGQVIGYACRFNKPDGGKDVLPYCKHHDGWHWKAPAEPRPLFNQHKLTRSPDKPVLVAEGEKAAEAAAKLFPEHIVTTWQGGTGAAAKAAWDQLKGRPVVIWPDADEPGKKAAGVVAEALRLHGSTVQILTTPDGVARGWDAADAVAEGWTPEKAAGLMGGPTPKADKSGLKILSAASLTLDDAKTEWVLYGVKEKDTLAISYGESGSKKSFIEIDQLFSVAAGRPWHGREVEQGAVLYVAGEGGKALAKRIIGLAQHRKIKLDGLPFYYTNQAVEFLNPESVAQLRPLITEIVKTENLVAISIDTLSRCFGPGDENSNRDMAAFVAELDKLRVEFGCAVSVVHHTGNFEKERERGAYALRAAADWRWLVSEDAAGIIRLTCKKAKDFEEPPPLCFKAEQVHISGQFDDEGRPVTTLVLHEVEPPKESAKRKRLSPGNRLALSALQACLVNSDDAHLEGWRKEFYATSTADTQGAKQKAFTRARADLVALGLVACRNDHYSIQTPGQTRTNPDNVRPCLADHPDDTGHIPLGMSGLSGLPTPANQDEYIEVEI